MIPTDYGPVEIVYEDNHLLVVTKPVGIPVQADVTGVTDIQTVLKDWLKKTKNKPGSVFLSIVHRLDRPVGGVMVFAKTSKAASRLSDQFRRNDVDKFYLAALQHLPPDSEGRLHHYLLKDYKQNVVRSVSKDKMGAKAASLSYRVLQNSNQLTLAAIRLETGRSHQIRVQFSTSGAPLYGDHKYGNSSSGSPALYSAGIRINHPTRKEPLWFFASPPAGTPWNSFNLPDQQFWKSWKEALKN